MYYIRCHVALDGMRGLCLSLDPRSLIKSIDRDLEIFKLQPHSPSSMLETTRATPHSFPYQFFLALHINQASSAVSSSPRGGNELLWRSWGIGLWWRGRWEHRHCGGMRRKTWWTRESNTKATRLLLLLLLFNSILFDFSNAIQLSEQPLGFKFTPAMDVWLNEFNSTFFVISQKKTVKAGVRKCLF